MRHGKGIFTFSSGEIIEGTFENDKITGFCI